MMLPIDTDMFPQKKGVYVVGGSIRDILCGRTPFDYDLAVQSDPAVFAGHLASRTSGRIVELGKHGQLMRRVVTGNHFFDILPVNGKSIQDDLRQRDFTINAMAMEVFSGNLIDQLGGRHDIAAKKVRMVTRDVFRKDPVRLIRAYRMAASLDFTIDEGTQTAIARDANLIRQSAGERIREELLKIIQCAKSHVYLSQMADSGLLFSIFYELRKLKNDHLPIDAPCSLFEQTLASYYHLEKLLDPGNPIMRTIGDKFFQDGDKSQPGLLKLTVLFHDIGKPSAQAPTGGPISGVCYHHTVESAAMANEICRRLRFSRRQTDYIEFIIRNQLRPLHLFRARQKKVPIQKGFIRFCMKCGDFTPDILLHALAGLSAKRVSDNQSIQDFTEFVQRLIQEYYRVLRPRASLPLPLNGMDLINEFGLKPSALFRRILKHVEEERLARQVLTREQAIKLVAELLKQ